MLQITADEFLEKAAASKGNVQYLIARETIGEQDAQDDLEEPPTIVSLGNISYVILLKDITIAFMTITSTIIINHYDIISALEHDPDYEAEIFQNDPPNWLLDNGAATVPENGKFNQ